MAITLTNGRKSPRAATNHLAGLEWRKGTVNARVIDLSMTGARLATQTAIAVGEPVTLTTVRMGSRPAIVVRTADSEISISFTDDIAREFDARRSVPDTR